MRTQSSVVLEAGLEEVAPFVSDLGRYSEWMPLVHEAIAEGHDVWRIELRAKVGVFARSKRLRMRRVVAEPRCWVFERDENDGRRHSMWRLSVDLDPDSTLCAVTMTLEYGGSLWTGGILDRVLAAHIEDGKSGLADLVARQ